VTSSARRLEPNLLFRSGQSAGAGFSLRSEPTRLNGFTVGRIGNPSYTRHLMAISPYANCPCGSGKQFKWCCQPYYSSVEKALSQHERGQHAAAEQTLEQLVERFPKVPQAYGYQAQVLFLHDKDGEADAALQKAFDLDANFAFGFWLRGLMRLDRGEAVGALSL